MRVREGPQENNHLSVSEVEKRQRKQERMKGQVTPGCQEPAGEGLSERGEPTGQGWKGNRARKGHEKMGQWCGPW